MNVGQFVLASEPVASMGDGVARTAAAIAIGAKQPILYVEFRKDGTSIELGPMVGEARHAEGWRMMRKTALVVTGIAIGAGCATLGQQARSLLGASALAAVASDTYKHLSLFGDVFDKVRADYVEKPDEQKLVESAINGMLSSLDPHSSYLDAKGFKDMRTQTEGKFGGLGIEVTQDDGFVKVVTPIDDTPAARAGIMSGDLIAVIDGESVQGMTLNQAVDKMRGAINTPVKLTILRGKDKQKIDVPLVRAEILYQIRALA